MVYFISQSVMFAFIFVTGGHSMLQQAVGFGVMKLRKCRCNFEMLQYLLQPEQVSNFNKFKYY